MSDKLKARPKYNRDAKKWNVVVEHKGREIPVGHSIGNSDFFERTKFDTKQDAIKWIEESGKFELKGDK